MRADVECDPDDSEVNQSFGFRLFSKVPSGISRATFGGNVEQGMFVTREEYACFIHVTDVYEQSLDELDERDAEREGGIRSNETSERCAERERLNGRRISPY